MSRPNRMQLDYPYYHIITRGNQKQIVFRADGDCEYYLSSLKKAKRKYNILLYAYCLMPNHVHLLIETKSAHDMSKFMHCVNLSYVSYFNTKYEKVGHLWQGRYISKPILREKYLIDCASYIEANPVRKEMTKYIEDYKWSSYRERYLSTKRFLLDDISEDIHRGTVSALPTEQVEATF